MQKKRILKVACLTLLLLTVISSFCLARFSYIVGFDIGLGEKKVNFFQKAAMCLADTDVEYGHISGTVVFLKTLDSDGDWVTVTAWSDYDTTYSCVDETFVVPDGSYKLETIHKAYAPTDVNHTTPLEIHYDETGVLVID